MSRCLHARWFQGRARPGSQGIARVHAELRGWQPGDEQRGRQERPRQERAALPTVRAAAHPRRQRAQGCGRGQGRRGRAHLRLAPGRQRRAHARALRRRLSRRRPLACRGDRSHGHLCAAPQGRQSRGQGEARQG